MAESGGAGRGIRSQLSRIVLIPAVTFLLLFVVLSAATVAQAVSLRAASADGEDGVALYHALVELQHERELAVRYLGDPTSEGLDQLRGQQGTADDALEALPLGGGSSAARFRLALREHGTLREDVAAERIDRDAVQRRYNAVIERGIGYYDARGRLFQDGGSVAASTTVVQLLRAQETFAQADALLSGAVAADELTGAEQAAFSGLVAELDRRLAEVAPVLVAEPARAYDDLTGSREWATALASAEAVGAWAPVQEEPDPVTGQSPDPQTLPPAAADWNPAAEAADPMLVAVADAQARATIAAIDAASARMLSIAVGGGIMALFAGTLAYGIASRTAARLTSRLSRLRRETLDLAGTELPNIVRRLERGESVDLRVQPRRLDYGTDEVGQVADAFNTAQRTAVAAAVKQSAIRAGANRVFLAIAYRDQALVQRQLHLLDRVEREEEDPDLLEDLFQLDHLATRGRRNAENLIILAGGRPGRRWRNPIPLMDVLRSAISEIEEYPRVRVRTAPELALRGEAVADVIHLVAELVENAAFYSPPHTKVLIHSEVVPKGLVVEVEDRGLGISEENLTAANATLESTPEFDVMALDEDARLGLFVVARLAAKHDVRVRLCNSAYGGTRAIVLIPTELVVGVNRLEPVPSAARTPSAPPTGEGDGDLLAQPRAGQRVPEPLRKGPFAEQSRHAAPPLRLTSANARPEGAAVPYNGTPPTGEAERPAAGERSVQPTRRGGTAPPAQDDRGSRPRLPKRRSQSHLAPQLRDEPGPAERPAASPRSPDQARMMMSAFQSGTRLGRENQSADQVEPSGAPNGAGAPSTETRK